MNAGPTPASAPDTRRDLVATPPAPREPPPVRSSTATLVAVWLVVAVPAIWGVSQTAIKSLDLFRSPPPAAAATHPA